MICLAFEGGTGAEILCANALLENETLHNAFDVILTNPPFGSKGKVENQKILKPYVLARKWNKLTKADDFRAASDSDIRYIAISDVDARTMQVVSQQTLKAHEAPSRATFRVRAGDIITAVSGASTGTTRQATALITADEDGAICSNGFAVLRSVHGVEPLFLLAYMRTEYYLRQVRRLMTGHAIPVISIEDLSTILTPIPPQKEQERIANSIAHIQAMRREALKTGANVITETDTLIGQLAAKED
jgi:type I restriction enzyme M protein